jgi:hypothetical protein
MLSILNQCVSGEHCVVAPTLLTSCMYAPLSLIFWFQESMFSFQKNSIS